MESTNESRMITIKVPAITVVNFFLAATVLLLIGMVTCLKFGKLELAACTFIASMILGAKAENIREKYFGRTKVPGDDLDKIWL